MAEERTLRKKVEECTGVLLKAVDLLKESSSGSTTASRDLPGPSSTRPDHRGVPIASRSTSTSSLSTSKEELNKLFNWNPTSVGFKRKQDKTIKPKSKKKKLKTWTHTFVCLSRRDQSTIPDSDEKAALARVGLGEKSLSVFYYAEAEGLYSELLLNFPKLCEGGGFELLTVSDRGGKDLKLLQPPQGGYTTEFLKSCVNYAKIFIRPLQHNLSMSCNDLLETVSQDVTEMCFKCNKFLPMYVLKDHLAECSRKDDVIPEPKESCANEDAMGWEVDNFDIEPMTGISGDTETNNDVILVEQEECPSQPRSIDDVIKSARSVLLKENFTFLVRREHILKDSLKRMLKVNFSPSKKIVVDFLGEEGTDTGGITREFFTLLAKNIQMSYMCNGTFMHNSVALQDELFLKFGKLAAMAIAQGAAGFHILSHSVYNYISGMSASDIIVCVDEVGNIEVQTFIRKIMKCTTVEEVRQFATEELDLLLASGFTKPPSTLSWDDRVILVQSLTLHHVILESKAEIDQFIDGLKCFGILDNIKEHPLLLKSFLCLRTNILTSEDILELLNKSLSEIGSTSREVEMEAYMNFVSYLEECERAEKNNSVEEEGLVPIRSVLSFFSGGEEIPPMGFDYEPQVNFNEDNVYPTASTCAVQLTLPTKYKQYESFKSAMTQGFLCHGGFGLK